MIPISIPWMLEVVRSLERIDSLTPETTFSTAWFDMLELQFRLEELFRESIYTPYLRTSRVKGDDLYKAVKEIVDIPSGDPKEKLPLRGQAAWLRSKRDDFQLVFLSEISTLPVYMVTPKDNYDVTLLIGRGAGLFPPTLLAKVPEAAFDAAEVGRALAFQLATACGFHTFRVVESVLRRYWDAASAGKPRPDPQTIGKFAADMESQKIGDVTVRESLKQLAKLHRNPCIHPDVALTDEEAIGIIGMSRSVIGGMLAILPDAPPPTTVASHAGSAP